MRECVEIKTPCRSLLEHPHPVALALCQPIAVGGRIWGFTFYERTM
ncbi:hypothetical protein EIO_1879 [Ketogulonicigenium vulgare Y25]|nr:hypothetical protein EIO_1879 [Ketogulonicigenium vulgare Y25]AOZ54905.1 hypothetical protein KVC_1898 [Ketogulonicigenium vulgare]